MVNQAASTVAPSLALWRALLVALLLVGLTGTSLRAQEGQGSTGTWRVVAGDQTGPGQFDSPFGVAVDAEGNVYVADTGNHRIQKLSAAGQPLAQWGGPGHFMQPLGLALDDQGNVYVADTGNDRIQKLSSAGEPLAVWGGPGTGPGQFASPTGVAVDRQGNVYV